MCHIFHIFLFWLAHVCLCWQSNCVNLITWTKLIQHSEAQAVDRSKEKNSGSEEQNISFSIVETHGTCITQDLFPSGW